jgi:hypothetical protein
MAEGRKASLDHQTQPTFEDAHQGKELEALPLEYISFTPGSILDRFNCERYDAFLKDMTTIKLAYCPPCELDQEEAARVSGWIKVLRQEQQVPADLAFACGTDYRLVRSFIGNDRIISVSLFGDPRHYNGGGLDHFCKMVGFSKEQPLEPEELRLGKVNVESIGGKTLPISLKELRNLAVYNCPRSRGLLNLASKQAKALKNLLVSQSDEKDELAAGTHKNLPKTRFRPPGTALRQPKGYRQYHEEQTNTHKRSKKFDNWARGLPCEATLIKRLLKSCKELEGLSYHLYGQSDETVEEMVNAFGKQMQILSLKASKTTFAPSLVEKIVERCPRLQGLALDIVFEESDPKKTLQSIAVSILSQTPFNSLIVSEHTLPISRSPLVSRLCIHGPRIQGAC